MSDERTERTCALDATTTESQNARPCERSEGAAGVVASSTFFSGPSKNVGFMGRAAWVRAAIYAIVRAVYSAGTLSVRREVHALG